MLNNKIKSKLYTYFLTRLGMRNYNRGWLKGDCPYCGKEDKFGVNLSLDRSNCFYCGPKLSPFELIMDLENLDKFGVLKLLNEADLIEYYEKEVIRELPKHNLKLPDGFKLLNIGSSQLAKSARSYVKSRGFNPESMALKGWGYGTEGKYWGYLIIPIFFRGKLVYYTSRNFLSSGPKFLNLNSDEYDRGKNTIIYNHEALFLYDRVRIVESIMNAETLGNNTIAINGKVLSDFQFSQIIKSPVEYFSVLLDNDARKWAIDICIKLSPFKNVKPVFFEDDRDVNDLGKVETLKRIYKSRYLKYNELILLKNEEPFFTYNSI